MRILCTDLDNTLIYSYKHDIGNEKRNVELYQGREISFITEKTYALLNNVKNEYQIVPTTTRTIEQYERIDLGIGTFSYALVCNGGVLLLDGRKDEKWYEESRILVSQSIPYIETAMRYLEQDSRRIFELRYIEELFLFTKCEFPEKITDELREILNTDVVRVFHNGTKIYVVPQTLSKGRAINRLRDYLSPECILAAGDSEFDLSMVQEADRAYVPYGFKKQFSTPGHVLEMPEKALFSESFLEACLK